MQVVSELLRGNGGRQLQGGFGSAVIDFGRTDFSWFGITFFREGRGPPVESLMSST